MSIVKYIKEQQKLEGSPISVVRCVDGFFVSCQASRFHYCSPREDNADLTHIELGYPSALPTVKIRDYAESKRNLLDTVYGYVPVELVDAMLKKHGGIVE